MTDTAQQEFLTIDDKQYSINSLSDHAKELIKGLQVADAQLQMTHDQLNVMMVARRTLLDQLATELSGVEPIKPSLITNG